MTNSCPALTVSSITSVNDYEPTTNTAFEVNAGNGGYLNRLGITNCPLTLELWDATANTRITPSASDKVTLTTSTGAIKVDQTALSTGNFKIKYIYGHLYTGSDFTNSFTVTVKCPAATAVTLTAA